MNDEVQTPEVTTPAETTAPIPSKTPRPPLAEANGVKRPAAGGKTAIVWETCDAISAEKKRPALRAEVMDALKAQGLSPGTIATQYGKWCVFYGVDAKARQEVKANKKAAAAAAAAPAPAPEATPVAETPAEA